jgi:hypothetical protein
VLLLLGILGNNGSQGDGSELHQRPIGRPVNSGVIYDILFRRNLNRNGEHYGLLGQALGDLIEEIVRALLRGRVRCKVVAAGGRLNAIAAEFGNAFTVRKLVRVDGKERFVREASGEGFWNLNELQRGGMRCQEGLDSLRPPTDGMQQFDEFFDCSRGEGIDGMPDDVGVAVGGKIEPDGDSTRTGVGIVVRNVRDASEI